MNASSAALARVHCRAVRAAAPATSVRPAPSSGTVARQTISRREARAVEERAASSPAAGSSTRVALQHSRSGRRAGSTAGPRPAPRTGPARGESDTPDRTSQPPRPGRARLLPHSCSPRHGTGMQAADAVRPGRRRERGSSAAAPRRHTTPTDLALSVRRPRLHAPGAARPGRAAAPAARRRRPCPARPRRRAWRPVRRGRHSAPTASASPRSPARPAGPPASHSASSEK